MRSMRLGMGAALAMTFAIAACGGEQPAPQPPPPPSLPAPVSTMASTPPLEAPPPAPKPTLAEVIPQTLRGIDDAFNTHDAKKVASFYSEDCVVTAYGGSDARGRDEVTKAMQGVFDAFGDARSAALRGWTKGNVMVAELAWAGTMTGDLMGMKATHKPAGQIRMHVMSFNDDGLVKEMREYGDDAGLMAQLAGKKGAPPVPLLPTNSPEMHVAQGTPDEDKLADWGKGVDDAFSKGDAKAAVATLADDADVWLNFTGMPATKGKKDLTKELTGWFKAFPDQKWTTTNAWGIDGFAIIEHTMSGTQKGAFGALPASNKPVTSWHWIDVMQPAADGKTRHDWGYANLVEMMKQTGTLKQPGDKPAGTAPKAGAANSEPQKK